MQLMKLLKMLLTKLHIPFPRKNLVHRKNLYDKLNEGLNRKLILVSAPAGYGKTTLVCDWLNQCKIPTAWFSIDHRDNDPFEFLTFVISAIQTIHKNIGNHSLELLKSPGTVNTKYIVEFLINDILTIKTDFLLVLDDLHTITSKEIFNILNIIIDHKPKHFKIAILTRSDPILSIARLRSQNELLEIRSADLSFTENDIAEFFNKKLKLGLTDKDINLLELKTEGWIAGLQLTAITLQNKKNISEFIESISGDNRYIMDYLIEEVLNNQDDETREFLLKTAIFEKFSGPLCDTVFQKNNSQLLLESLEKGNLFIVPLDNERNWYRYHHLFGDLLKHRLNIRHKENIPYLHSSASKWFENNNMYLFAIEHAIQAGKSELALQLLDKIIENLWMNAQYDTICKLGSSFTEEEIASNSDFCIIYAWSLGLTGKLSEGKNYLKKLETQLSNKKSNSEHTELLGKIYLAYNYISAYASDTDAAFEYSELVIKNLSGKEDIWNAWAYIANAESYFLRFELDKCLISQQSALEISKKLKSSYLMLGSTIKIAFILRLKGKYKESYKICTELLESFTSNPDIESNKLGILTFLYSIIGFIQVEWNLIEEGMQNVLKGFKLSQKAVYISFRGYCAFNLAETYYKIGKLHEAIALLEEQEFLFKKETASRLETLVISLKNKLYIEMGEFGKIQFPEKYTSDNLFAYIFFNISKARYYILQSKYTDAIDLLNKLAELLNKLEAFELFIEVELLKVKIFALTKEKTKALNCLVKVIQIAQTESLIRVFINEGEQIEELVKEIYKEKLSKIPNSLDIISEDYINNLKTAFEIEGKRKNALSNKDLSPRELEILKLISKKLSNHEICETLYISLSTVKTHISNILLKLEVKNRIEATEIAKEKGLI
jgi:LuxR family transcriptional regulator, maltose regulon positive regulatory protein